MSNESGVMGQLDTTIQQAREAKAALETQLAGLTAKLATLELAQKLTAVLAAVESDGGFEVRVSIIGSTKGSNSQVVLSEDTNDPAFRTAVADLLRRRTTSLTQP